MTIMLSSCDVSDISEKNIEETIIDFNESIEERDEVTSSSIDSSEIIATTEETSSNEKVEETIATVREQVEIMKASLESICNTEEYKERNSEGGYVKKIEIDKMLDFNPLIEAMRSGSDTCVFEQLRGYMLEEDYDVSDMTITEVNKYFFSLSYEKQVDILKKIFIVSEKSREVDLYDFGVKAKKGELENVYGYKSDPPGIFERKLNEEMIKLYTKINQLSMEEQYCVAYEGDVIDGDVDACRELAKSDDHRKELIPADVLDYHELISILEVLKDDYIVEQIVVNMDIIYGEKGKTWGEIQDEFFSLPYDKQRKVLGNLISKMAKELEYTLVTSYSYTVDEIDDGEIKKVENINANPKSVQILRIPVFIEMDIMLYDKEKDNTADLIY